MTVHDIVTNGDCGGQEAGLSNSSSSTSSSEDIPTSGANQVVGMSSRIDAVQLDTTSTNGGFFVWSLPPQRPDAAEANRYVCDLCHMSIEEGGEEALKLHQMQTHINPFYLSASDRISAKIHSYAVKTTGGAANWIPNWDTFQGLYRCHECFSIWDIGSELATHLLQNHFLLPSQQQQQQQQDKEEEEDMPLNKVKRLRMDNDNGKENKKTLSVKKLSPPRKPRRKQTLASPQKKEEGKDKRPDRKCKSMTNTLVAISLADERIDLDFCDVDSNSKEELSQNGPDHQVLLEEASASSSSTSSPTSQPLKQENNFALDKVSQELHQDSNNDISQRDDRSPQHPSTNSSSSNSVKVESSTTDSVPISPRKRGRPKGSFKKKKKKRVQQLTKTGTRQKKKKMMKMRRPKRKCVVKNIATTSPTTTTKRVEDILPDLVPPSARSKRTTEAERSAAIVKQVVEMDKLFCCLYCCQYFATFQQLCDHKNARICHPIMDAKKADSKLLKPAPPIVERKRVEWQKRFGEPCDKDYSVYVSDAIKNVPECTFNNMHGTVHHVDSVDGGIFRSKPDMGTIDKVKMNISGQWSTKDVWESGGWEIGTDHLTWQKYESRWNTENRRFLQSMSHLPWPEQRRFKQVFDQSLSSKVRLKKKDECEFASREKRGMAAKKQTVPHILDLKQQGRSIKYMTNTEREELRKKLAKQELENEKADPVHGHLNGEWESQHDFMCSTCAIVYDELREVLHHKWDDHPYCLVAHVTLEENLRLPPSGMIHPQLGRGLSINRGAMTAANVSGDTKRKSSRKVEVKTELEAIATRKYQCTKCVATFDSQEQFYVHVLECGGDLEWDVSKKKKKRKRMLQQQQQANGNGSGSLKPLRRMNSEELEEKRRARFERFNRPPPLAHKNGGRMTRLQAVIIKKERQMSRKKKGQQKKKKQSSDKKNNGDKVKQSKAKKRTVPSSAAPALTNRSRRATANYGAVLVHNQPSYREVIKQLMSDMLDKVEKAAAVLDEAEKLNLDMEQARRRSKRVGRKRKSSPSPLPVEEKITQPLLESIQPSNNSNEESHVLVEPLSEVTDDADSGIVTHTPSNDSDSSLFGSDEKMTKLPKKRRSSIAAASFRLNNPTTQRSMRKSLDSFLSSSSSSSSSKADDSGLKVLPVQRRRSQGSKSVDCITSSLHKKANRRKSVDPALIMPQKRKRTRTISFHDQPSEIGDKPSIITDEKSSGKTDNSIDDESSRTKTDNNIDDKSDSTKIEEEDKPLIGKVRKVKKVKTIETSIKDLGLEEQTIVVSSKPKNNDELVTTAVKSRRSSFANSFYASQPISERSLRRRLQEHEPVPEEEEDTKLEDEIIPNQVREASPIKTHHNDRLLEAKILPTRRHSLIEMDPVVEEEIGVLQDEVDLPKLLPSSSSCSRPRRSAHKTTPHMQNSSHGSSVTRVIFPLEVKACAIERINSGATQVQVARDLHCPVSTVASWWQRRHTITKSVEIEPSEYDKKLDQEDRKELLNTMKQHFNDDDERNVIVEQSNGIEDERVEFSSEDNSEVEEDVRQVDKILDKLDKLDNDSRSSTCSSEKPAGLIIMTPSEESSNDSSAVDDGENIKNKILRTCFASLHRRQQMEQQQQHEQLMKTFQSNE